MNELYEEQFRFNQDSSSNWDCGTAHRETITGYLSGLVKEKQGRLCVLGAGNCNDLDLNQLLEVFNEIHLVDLDERALGHALDFQKLSDHPQISLHVCDLTGIGQQLAGWTEGTNDSDASLAEIVLQLLKPAALNLPGPFDVVCSMCLLSQLIHLVVSTVGDTHSRFEELMTAIRFQHLQTLCELSGENGAGLLVSDFVSSASAPDMPDVPDDQFEQYLSQLLSSRNFFHGVHPGVLYSIFVGNTPLASHVRDVEMLPPSRWNLGARQYAIAAIRFWGIKQT